MCIKCAVHLRIVLHNGFGVARVFQELGYRVTSHKLEYRILGLVVELDDLLHCLQELKIRQLEFGHAADECVAEVVVDVELAWRSGCKERIVKIWLQSALHFGAE